MVIWLIFLAGTFIGLTVGAAVEREESGAGWWPYHAAIALLAAYSLTAVYLVMNGLWAVFQWS